MTKWYVLQVKSGGENKTVEEINKNLVKNALSSFVEEISIPSYEIPGIKRGKSVLLEKKIMPGYIFIKMQLNDKLQQVLQDITGVNKFLGSKTAPQPISEEEVKRVFSHMESAAKNATLMNLYQINEQVIVTDGPFKEFGGIIENVNIEKQMLKVLISVFGQPTPVEFSFDQVRKT